MSASVVAAFVCAVFAAVGCGVLVGRSIRMPRMDLPAWAATLAALAVALVAQGYGSYRGYSSGTFRAVQFGAQLIAPLWLAWGLAELTAKSVTVRFGAKLITMALTVVTGVVLITDPLSSTPFSKSWPAASAHYQIIPRSLLSLIAAVTIAAAVLALISALLRLRGDPSWRRAFIPIAAAGIAAVGILALRLTLPSAGYLAVCAGCAALTWFAGAWAGKIGLVSLHERARPATVKASPEPAMLAAPEGDDARGAGYARRGEERGQRRNEDPFGIDQWYRPAGGSRGTSQYQRGAGDQRDGGNTMHGLQQGDGRDWPQHTDRTDVWRPRTLGAGGAAPAGGTGLGSGARVAGDAALGGGARLPGAEPGGRSRPGADRGPGGDRDLAGDRGLGGNRGLGGDRDLAGNAGPGGSGGIGQTMVGDDAESRFSLRGGRLAGNAAPGDGELGGSNGLGGAGWPGGNGAPGGRLGGGGQPGDSAWPEPAAAAAMDQAATQRLYGLIAIYTLAEGTAADFDALAERVVEEVRVAEPDALVYAVHSVPNADMQRIFYEVYRDRMAYEDHQRQPHVRRFEEDREPYVLATNVIELGMQQAKLSPPASLSQLLGPPGA